MSDGSSAPTSIHHHPHPACAPVLSTSSSCLARRSLRQEISRDAASFPAACLASHPVCLTSPLVRIRGVCTLRDSLLACGAFEAEATPGETSVASRPSRRWALALPVLTRYLARPEAFSTTPRAGVNLLPTASTSGRSQPRAQCCLRGRRSQAQRYKPMGRRCSGRRPRGLADVNALG